MQCCSLICSTHAAPHDYSIGLSNCESWVKGIETAALAVLLHLLADDNMVLHNIVIL